MKNVKLLRAIMGLLLIVLLTETAFFGYREVIYRTSQHTTKPETKDNVVAQIGDHPILSSTLNDNLYAAHGAELLNQMLDREAIQMEADETGLKVERNDIDDELKRMQQGYESEDQFYKSMKEQVGMDKTQLREDVYYKLLLERIATKDVQVSDQEITNYMNAHSDEFKNSLQLHIEQIEVDSLDAAGKVIAELQGGADFAQMAKARSIDTATASDGGDLGWVEENDPFVPATIIRAATAMNVGDISKPIPVGAHFMIIRLIDRKENNKGSLVEIKTALRKQLALQKAAPLKEVTAALRKKRNAIILDPQLK
ncbi:MAG: yacD [Bacilli bacterium]|jgi:foldase protein PrsA|nr:yacD [Bacilli bacterium]